VSGARWALVCSCRAIALSNARGSDIAVGVGKDSAAPVPSSSSGSAGAAGGWAEDAAGTQRSGGREREASESSAKREVMSSEATAVAASWEWTRSWSRSICDSIYVNVVSSMYRGSDILYLVFQIC
jgi:hypothetical protein